ncbi:MAG: sensor histidine kinase [Paenibacillus sp.]|jgi:signal transduction histidine kinase|nr:sensor histidine kinase [Paenibacillus sp.]
MNRLHSWIISQPFKSFQFRHFLYVFFIGLLPIFAAAAYLYVHAAAQTGGEWRALITGKHDQVQRTIDAEMRELEYMYYSWLQDGSVGLLLQMSRDGREMSEAARRAREVIAQAAAFQMGYRKNISDLCFSFEGSGSFCAVGSPFDDNDHPIRLPANRNDLFVQEDGGTMINWIGPLYDPSNLVVIGYMKIVFNMTRMLDELRAQTQLSSLELWDAEAETALFDSGERDLKTIRSPAPYLSDKGTYMLNEHGVVVSQRPISVPGQTWVSYIEMPDTSKPSFKPTIDKAIVIFFAVHLIMSIVSAFIFSRLFSSPLQLLRRLMKRAESGDLKAYWTIGSVQDIDELGHSYNQMLNRLEETIKQAKLEEALKKEAEIQALHYQLNPHFLYNTLNTIKWVAKIHKTPQISEAVSALVRLLQASLGKKGDFLPLKEEIGLIQDYMAIQSFRYGETVKMQLNIDPLTTVCLVPKMMLQPLVENALIHGLENSAKDGVITISTWLDRDMLLCEVQDNGKGMESAEAILESRPRERSSKERMSGIGLQNIREKIKLYYGPDYKMHIFSKPNYGTTIRLSLPIHRDEETMG